ncbi:unnamed protein product [Didymodactylos carnosus]|uniref:Uncharacterized protein n=1 Tax=Didymodactylos carnosus TaxID=1234261 RepID=A0A816CVW9_9BILA|nr:unnamed protein product [Didymodactylos carnosus]CAF4520157.1 unnamed protein product [Didymodactylos carnosus]
MTSVKLCEIDECKRRAATLCHHCHKDVCKKHFNEHADSLNDELYPLTDQINELATKLSALSSSYITQQSYALLDEWRNGSCQLIEQLYQLKKHEIDVLVNDNFIEIKNEKEKVIRSLEENIKKFIRDDDVTHDAIEEMKETLRNVDKQIAELKDSFIHVQTSTVHIDKNCVIIHSRFLSHHNQKCK